MKKNYQSGNGFVGLIVIIALIWGVSSLFSSDTNDSNSYKSNYSSPAAASYPYSNQTNKSEQLIEPENPYDDGSGHSAGYEWAEENDPSYCDGNSQSFIEGCQEYLDQQDEYESENY